MIEISPLSVADGTAAEDPFLGTEAPLTDNHGTESVQEDIHPPVESNDVDPMQEDLLNEIYEKAADVSHSMPCLTKHIFLLDTQVLVCLGCLSE